MLADTLGVVDLQDISTTDVMGDSEEQLNQLMELLPDGRTKKNLPPLKTSLRKIRTSAAATQQLA